MAADWEASLDHHEEELWRHEECVNKAIGDAVAANNRMAATQREVTKQVSATTRGSDQGS